MINQQDLQAAYEYGVKLAYEHLQKNANADAMGRKLEPWETGVSGGANQSQRVPPDAAPHPQFEAPIPERGLGQMSAEELIAAIKGQGMGLKEQAVDQLKNFRVNAPQVGEVLKGGYGAANNVADRFLSHMGRHPAAYGLGAAGLGAAGLTGLGLGIGNAVHNSND